MERVNTKLWLSYLYDFCVYTISRCYFIATMHRFLYSVILGWEIVFPPFFYVFLLEIRTDNGLWTDTHSIWIGAVLFVPLGSLNWHNSSTPHYFFSESWCAQCLINAQSCTQGWFWNHNSKCVHFILHSQINPACCCVNSVDRNCCCQSNMTSHELPIECQEITYRLKTKEF